MLYQHCMMLSVHFRHAKTLDCRNENQINGTKLPRTPCKWREANAVSRLSTSELMGTVSLSLSISFFLTRFTRGFALFKGQAAICSAGTRGRRPKLDKAFISQQARFHIRHKCKLTCSWEYQMACLQLVFAFKPLPPRSCSRSMSRSRK